MAKSLIETLGIGFKEIDGLLYPRLECDERDHIATKQGGKYGYLWSSFMREKHPDRYRTLVRLGSLKLIAADVNEEAYELVEDMIHSYLKAHKPENPESTIERWKIHEQAKMVAEEFVLPDIVFKWR